MDDIILLHVNQLSVVGSLSEEDNRTCYVYYKCGTNPRPLYGQVVFLRQDVESQVAANNIYPTEGSRRE